MESCPRIQGVIVSIEASEPLFCLFQHALRQINADIVSVNIFLYDFKKCKTGSDSDLQNSFAIFDLRQFDSSLSCLRLRQPSPNVIYRSDPAYTAPISSCGICASRVSSSSRSRIRRHHENFILYFLLLSPNGITGMRRPFRMS